MSKHLKKFAAPITWPITRKDLVYIAKPLPGPHTQEFSLSIGLILRLLGYAKTTREIKKILNTQEILVDSKKIKELKFPAGLFDVVSIPSQNQHFRIVFDDKGKLKLLPIQKDETSKKITKIIGKKMIHGAKLQINLSDGRNFITKEKEYTVGDSLLIELPSQKIIEHLKLEKGACIYLVKGKHQCDIGTLEEINKDTIMYTTANKQKVQTAKQYAYVVGKKQPQIKLQ